MGRPSFSRTIAVRHGKTLGTLGVRACVHFAGIARAAACVLGLAASKDALELPVAPTVGPERPS